VRQRLGKFGLLRTAPMATVRNPMRRAYCTPRWPKPPSPWIATTSPGRAVDFFKALNVVHAGTEERRRIASM